PSQRRSSRHGVLKQLPSGNFELKLRKAWSHDVMALIDRAERLALLGQDEKSRAISLSSGFLKSYNLFAPGSSPATLRFNRAAVGAHFADLDSAPISKLAARIPVIDH